jgi:hypothetical protein
MKTCQTCNQEKELTEFYKNKANRGGYEIHCKECKKAKEVKEEAAIEKKKCTKCKKEKPLSEYCVKTYFKGGLNSQCKKCQALYRKSKAKPKRPHKEGQKVCAGCNETKDYGAFPRSRSSTDGYVHKCKLCYVTKRKESMDINYASFYYPIALD